MTESKSAFLDYRSPYVWHSRALNFNKQLIKKLNQVQKCNSNSKPRQPHCRTLGIAHHRRSAAGFRHHLLEASASNSSLSPSLSSSTAEAKEETPIIPNFYPKFQHNASQMARNYMDSYNTSRATGHYGPYGPVFSPPGGRCPVHSIAPGHYKHPGHYESATPRFSSAAELHHDYPALQPSHFLPYGYLYADKHTSYPLAPHYPYYSSHMYMPGSYLQHPMFLSSNSYTSKHLPPTYQPPPRRASRLYEYGSRQDNPEHTRSGSKCRGHFIVLAAILAVIVIGTLLGVILAAIN